MARIADLRMRDARRKKVVGKSHSQIEEIIGEELSYDAKTFDHFKTQLSVKRIISKFCIKFGYINTLTRMIYI